MDDAFKAAVEGGAAVNGRAGAKDRWTVKGELVCGECGELKMALLDSKAIRAQFGGPRLFSVACRCRREESDAIYAAQRETALKERREKAMPSARWRESRFEADDGRSRAIREMLEHYAERFSEMRDRNIGVALSGENGTGKTFWAACVANRLIEAGRRVKMATMASLVTGLSESETRNELLGEIEKADLLVIDDLGAERDTSFGLEKAFEVLDVRYNSKKPVLLTMNLSKAELDEPIDMQHARIYSRVKEMCPILAVVSGERRSAIAQVKREAAREIIRRRE